MGHSGTAYRCCMYQVLHYIHTCRKKSVITTIVGGPPCGEGVRASHFSRHVHSVLVHGLAAGERTAEHRTPLALALP